MRRFVTVLAVTLAALATPAFADDFSRSIPVTQAEHQDSAAATALYTRIGATAKSLCAKANPPVYGFETARMRTVALCTDETVDHAVQTAAIPLLAAVHAQALSDKASPGAVTTLASR